jgi:hypothetical protein
MDAVSAVYNWQYKSVSSLGAASSDEDEAYLPLGLIGIHIRLIYDEGKESALKRLKEEVNKPSKGIQPELITITALTATQNFMMLCSGSRLWTLPLNRTMLSVEDMNAPDNGFSTLQYSRTGCMVTKRYCFVPASQQLARRLWPLWP